MIRFIKNLYLSNRFFLVLGGVVVLFVAAFPFGFLLPVAQTMLIIVAVAAIVDILLLFNKRVKLQAGRRTPKVLSLGDEQNIYLNVENTSSLPLQLEVIDELPTQFQRRKFSMQLNLKGFEQQTLTYPITPVERGIYSFGSINLFVRSQLGLISRKVSVAAHEDLAVYPSIIQMKKFELKAFSRISTEQGIKRMRRIGHSYEFEQIKNYVQGDDPRSVNWKATSRRSELMVNQYEDERAQNIYSVIDKSRTMHMPFNGLSLLDHAINTSLVISNIALHKHDKAGLLTFSDKIGSSIKAERKRSQLRNIMEALYHQKERQTEADFGLMYNATRRFINVRSLLFLYTNFESLYALRRAMPHLRRIGRRHLLVVMVFENTEIFDFTQEKVTDLRGIYSQTIAQKYVEEKRQMIREMQQFGIQAILTRPEELSLKTVNKYLELKARGLI